MGREDTQLMNCRKMKMMLIYSIFVDCLTESLGSFFYGWQSFYKDALQGAVQKNALHAASLSQALVTVNQNFKLHQ